jgi:hypothetical protein
MSTLKAIVAAAIVVTSGSVSALDVDVLDWTPGAGSAQPSVTPARDGGVALTWQHKRGAEAELRVARFDVHEDVPAAPVTVARGGDWFVNSADFPSLAVLDNGDWVTFTLRKSAGSTYAYDIHLQRSLDGGATWQPPVKVNDDGQAVQHGFVALLPDGDDRVLLVWLDGRQDTAHGAHATHHASAQGVAHDHGHDEGPMTLRTAVLGRDGVPRAEAKLDADTCSCCQTDLVRRGGAAIAVYRDHAEGIRDIATVRRDREGRWQPPQAVHADHWRMPGCPVNGPAAAVNGDALAVLWPTMATGPLEVKLAISPRDGAAFAAPTVIDAGDTVLGRVDIAPWREGGFLVSWVSGGARGAVLRVAEVDARGRLSAPTTVVALPPGRQPGHPRLASIADGVALIAWTEPSAAGPRVRVAWID